MAGHSRDRLKYEDYQFGVKQVVRLFTDGQSEAQILNKITPFVEQRGYLPELATAMVRRGKRQYRVQQRWKLLGDFVDIHQKSLTGAEVAVWLCLYRDTQKNGLAQTAQTYISTRTGYSKRQVIRSLISLRAKGLLKLVKRGNQFHGLSLYRVSCPTQQVGDSGVTLPTV
jgi:hypothetical protein